MRYRCCSKKYYIISTVNILLYRVLGLWYLIGSLLVGGTTLKYYIIVSMLYIYTMSSTKLKICAAQNTMWIISSSCTNRLVLQCMTTIDTEYCIYSTITKVHATESLSTIIGHSSKGKYFILYLHIIVHSIEKICTHFYLFQSTI